MSVRKVMATAFLFSWTDRARNKPQLGESQLSLCSLFNLDAFIFLCRNKSILR